MRNQLFHKRNSQFRIIKQVFHKRNNQLWTKKQMFLTRQIRWRMK